MYDARTSSEARGRHREITWKHSDLRRSQSQKDLRAVIERAIHPPALCGYLSGDVGEHKGK